MLQSGDVGGRVNYKAAHGQFTAESLGVPVRTRVIPVKWASRTKRWARTVQGAADAYCLVASYMPCTRKDIDDHQ